MLSGFRDLLFPNVCRICQTKLAATELAPGKICSICWNKLEYIFPPYCLRCGHPSGDGHTASCNHCIALNPWFAFARSIGKYTGVLREAIQLFKLHYKEDLAEPLANLLIQYLKKSRDLADYQTYDYLIPVPLHPAKQRDREFNQVEVLARIISEQLNIPLSTDNLYRKRYTTPQMAISREKRLTNVSQAFAVRNPHLLTRKKIILLDDIMTTGATVNECSHMLKQAGCDKVAVLVLARGG
ncbi:MAG: ComF family protein [bacterium]|nr:ComF family protein [bacterium]